MIDYLIFRLLKKMKSSQKNKKRKPQNHKSTVQYKKTTWNPKTALKTVETHQKCPKMDKNTRKKRTSFNEFEAIYLRIPEPRRLPLHLPWLQRPFSRQKHAFRPVFHRKRAAQSDKDPIWGKIAILYRKVRKKRQELRKKSVQKRKKKKKRRGRESREKKKKKNQATPSHTFFNFFFMLHFQIQFPPFADQNRQ
jgi:hypothetical protein